MFFRRNKFKAIVPYLEFLGIVVLMTTFLVILTGN